MKQSWHLIEGLVDFTLHNRSKAEVYTTCCYPKLTFSAANRPSHYHVLGVNLELLLGLVDISRPNV